MNSLNRLTRLTAVAGLALLLAGCASQAAPAATVAPSPTASAQPAAYDPATMTAIEKAANDVVTSGRIPGAIVLVQTPAGRFEQAFGLSDPTTGQAMQTDEHSRIGSITKTMVITVLLQLVDQKKIELDSPVRSSLPELPETWKDVTVRQLAEMRSGIPSYTNSDAFGTQLVTEPQRDFTSAELLAFVEPLPLLFAPGTDFDYSNTNTVILGELIEKVTASSLAENLAGLFAQAGLTETAYDDLTADYPSPHPHGFTSQTADGSTVDASDWNPSWAQAAGAATSTAADLERWLHELTTGSLLSPEAQQQRLDYVSIPGNPTSTGYGLGIARTNGWIGHSGDLPGYSSTMYAREDGSEIIVFTSTDTRVDRADGTPISPSAAVAEAVTAVVVPDAPFVFPKVG